MHRTGTGATPVTEATSVPALLPWHQQQWRNVSGAFVAGRLSHALLLAGVSGVGKRAFARRVAAAVLCERNDGEVCGVCRSCRQFGGGAHPGYSVLRRDEDHRDIAIDAVRELCSTLAMTSHDGRAKVALIDSVDELNQNGANALLKTLEEPSPGSLLLLISERPLALPATLRSRCQLLRFGLPDTEQSLAWLAMQAPQVSVKERAAALKLARDAPLRAAELLADADEFASFDKWSILMRDLSDGRTDPLKAAAAVKREQVTVFLRWLAGWVLERLRHDLTDQSTRALARFGQAVSDAAKQVQGNANPLLTLESLLIGWSATLARTRRGD